MPFVPIPRVIRIVLKFQRDTREYQHVLHVQSAAAPTLTDLINAANEAVDWWSVEYSNGQANDVCLFAVIATDMSVEGGQQYTADVSPPTCGTSAVAVSPGNVTSTISWRTARTGRRYRGRTYVVGIDENQTSEFDTLAGFMVAHLASVAADWILRMLAVNLNPVVASFTYASAEPILSAVIENVLDSQRRRLPKRGR